jgi:hypothetical protein
MKKIFIAILSVFLFSKSGLSQSTINIPVKKLKIKYQNGEAIYINRINYFEYDQTNYTIDTVFVKNSMISFKKKDDNQFLILLNNRKETPITYLPLIQLREHYTSMFCGNFYKSDNYLLLSNQFNSEEYDYLNKFYKKFSKKSFDLELYEGPDYKKMDITDAQNLVEKRKQKYLEDLNRKQQELSQKFIEYLRTEIELGANNQFLNWYEETYSKEIEKEFKTTNTSKIHQNLYDDFISKKWNKNSIQYFRTIERIINFEESKKRKKLSTYFKNIEQRKEKAQKLKEKTASNTVYN